MLALRVLCGGMKGAQHEAGQALLVGFILHGSQDATARQGCPHCLLLLCRTRSCLRTSRRVIVTFPRESAFLPKATDRLMQAYSAASFPSPTTALWKWLYPPYTHAAKRSSYFLTASACVYVSLVIHVRATGSRPRTLSDCLSAAFCQRSSLRGRGGRLYDGLAPLTCESQVRSQGAGQSFPMLSASVTFSCPPSQPIRAWKTTPF
ncbi:hypothetical protein V8E36_006840 [Tilletia maclaganii]